ncbi:MAG: DUF4221 family protein, partial [Muribaculum sp.]|nr:DUF4221 family protein [Muribaculum sp.]
MKKLSIIATAVVCLTICSCSGRSQHNNRDIRMSIDSAAIEGNGYLILPSYNITSRIGEDSVLLCYNYKSHAIDRFNLKSKKTLSPIQLNIDGPDGIPGRVNTISVVDDSLIAVNDGIRQYLIDTDGHVVERYEYPLSANSIVSRNARTHNASLALSADGRQLRYPVFSSDTIAMVYFDIREDIDSFKTYEITRLTGAHEYGFLLYPNVSSTDSLVIFNYPYESTFTVLDINTGKQLTVDDHSQFAPDRAKKCPKDDI